MTPTTENTPGLDRQFKRLCGGVGLALSAAMLRSVFVLAMCSLLFACTDGLEDRLTELDDETMIDCGEVLDCTPQAQTDSVVACLEQHLADGVPAKAFFILGIEEVAYVYAQQGVYRTIQGYYYEGPNFTEYLCGGIETMTDRTCVMASTTNCTAVRDWYD